MRSRLSVRRPHIRVQLTNRRKNLGKVARSQRRQFQQWIQSAVLPDPIAEKRQQVFAALALVTQENNQTVDAEKSQKKRDKKKAKKQDSKAEEAKRISEQKKAAEREARKAEADAKQRAAEEEEHKRWKAEQERIEKENAKKDEEVKQLKEQQKKAAKAEKKNKPKKDSESAAAATAEEQVVLKKVNHTEKSPEPPTPTNTPAEPADHEPHKENAKKNKKNKKASESEKVAEPVVEETKEVHVESGASKKNKKSKKHSESGNDNTVAVEAAHHGTQEEEHVQKSEVAKSESSAKPTADNLDFLDFVTPKNAEPEVAAAEHANVQEQTPVAHEDEEGSQKKNKNKNKKNKSKKNSESESAAPAQQNASEETFEKKVVTEQTAESQKAEEPAKQPAVSAKPTADDLDFLDFVTPKKDASDDVEEEKTAVHEEHVHASHEEEKSVESSEQQNFSPSQVDNNQESKDIETLQNDEPVVSEIQEDLFSSEEHGQNSDNSEKPNGPEKPTADNLDFLDFVTPKNDGSETVEKIEPAVLEAQEEQTHPSEDDVGKITEPSQESVPSYAPNAENVDVSEETNSKENELEAGTHSHEHAENESEKSPVVDEHQTSEHEAEFIENKAEKLSESEPEGAPVEDHTDEKQAVVSKNQEAEELPEGSENSEKHVAPEVGSADNESLVQQEQNTVAAENNESHSSVVSHDENKVTEKKQKNKKNKNKKHSESESASPVHEETHEKQSVAPLNEGNNDLHKSGEQSENVVVHEHDSTSDIQKIDESVSVDAQAEEIPVVSHDENKTSDKKHKNKKNKNKKHSESESATPAHEESHDKHSESPLNEGVAEPPKSEVHSEKQVAPSPKPTADDLDFLDFVTRKKNESEHVEPQEKQSPVETPDENKTSEKKSKHKKNKNKKHSESESTAPVQEETHEKESVAPLNEKTPDSAKTTDLQNEQVESTKSTVDDFDFLDFVTPKKDKSENIETQPVSFEHEHKEESQPIVSQDNDESASKEELGANTTSDDFDFLDFVTPKKDVSDESETHEEKVETVGQNVDEASGKKKSKKNKGKKNSESESAPTAQEHSAKQSDAPLGENKHEATEPAKQPASSAKPTADDLDFLDFVTPKKETSDATESAPAAPAEVQESQSPVSAHEESTGKKKNKKNKNKKHSESDSGSAVAHHASSEETFEKKIVTPSNEQSSETPKSEAEHVAAAAHEESHSPADAHDQDKASGKKKNKKNKNKKHSESEAAAPAHNETAEENVEKKTEEEVAVESKKQPAFSAKPTADDLDFLDFVTPKKDSSDDVESAPVIADDNKAQSPASAHEEASGKKKNKKNKNKKHSESEAAAPAHNEVAEENVEKKTEEEVAVETNKQPAFSAKPTADDLDFLDFVTPKKDSSEDVESAPAAADDNKAQSPAHEEASGKKKNKKNKNKKHSESESAAPAHNEHSEKVAEKKIITPEEELAAERAEAAAAQEKKAEAEREASPAEAESSGKKKNKKNKNKKHSESESSAPSAAAPAPASAPVHETEVEETFEKKIVSQSTEQHSESSKDKKNKKNKKKGSGHSESKEVVIPASEPQQEPKFVEIPSNDTNEAGKGSPSSDKENSTHAAVNGGNNATEQQGSGNDKKNKKKNKKNKNSNSISEKEHHVITDLENEAHLDQLADDEVGAITGGASQSSPVQVHEVSSTEGNTNGGNVEKTTTIQINQEVDRSNLSPTQFQKNVEKLVQATLAKHEIVEIDPTVKMQIDAQLIRMSQKKAPAVVIEHKNYIKPLPMELHISRPSTPSRDRLYKLLPKDILFCAGLIDTHGENYAAMAKDPRNTFMETSRSLQRKIRIFKDSPHFQTYLHAKEDGRPLEEAIAAEENLNH